MKRLIMIFLLVDTVYGANEVRSFVAGAPTCYYIVRAIDGTVWYVIGEVFEDWGTGGRTAADYDLGLTHKSGGFYLGDFDTAITTDYYYLVTHQQEGGSPADTDPPVWVEYGYWDTSTWTSYPKVDNDAIADAVWDEAMAGHTTETTFGGELQTLDPNITLILADTDELQTDWADGGRLDTIVDAIKAITDILTMPVTTVSDANDANSFTITAGPTVDDAYLGHIIMVEDAGDGNREVRCITDWTDARVVEVDAPFSFTPDVADQVWVMATAYLDELIEAIERIGQTTNVIDGTGGAVGGLGMTIFDAAGDDP